MKKISFFLVAFILVLANTSLAQRKAANLKGAMTPDGYLGRIGLEFNLGYETASGDHTNVTDGDIQDMSSSNFDIGQEQPIRLLKT